MEIADRDNLLRDIRIYLLSVLRVANADVLPFDWRATTCRVQGHHRRHTRSRARALLDLSPSMAATQDARRCAGSLPGASRREAWQRTANGFSFVLPAFSCRSTTPAKPRFRHDPAFTVPPLPTLAVVADLPDIEERSAGFGLTQAVRGQNRLIAALREATRLVRGCA